MKLSILCHTCAVRLMKVALNVQAMENKDRDIATLLSQCINCRDNLVLRDKGQTDDDNKCLNGYTAKKSNKTAACNNSEETVKTLADFIRNIEIDYNGITLTNNTENADIEIDYNGITLTNNTENADTEVGEYSLSIPKVLTRVSGRAQFGEEIRNEFLLDAGSTFLNNGSYGAVPKRVHEYKCRLQQRMERHPQKWFVHDFPRMLQQAVDKVASFLGTQPEDTFLVQNVTKGCNTVIKAYPLAPGDAILVSNLTYPAIANTARHAADTKGAEVVTLDITFPIASEEELVNKFEQTLLAHPNIKLTVIDHITSSTALLVPVKHLTEVCHRYDVIVLIDGAHTPGQLAVNYADVDADFYTGNFHKWAFTPRGCAVLWQNPRRKHPWFRPLVTSCEHGTTLQEEFGYEGIKDDTSYYSVTEALDFIESVGGLETLSAYNTALKREAFSYLSTAWTTTSISVPASMVAPFMKLLQLPRLKDFNETPEDAGKLQRHIIDKHDADCKIYSRDQKLFVRLSVQIYNNMDDFRKLNSVIQQLRC